MESASRSSGDEDEFARAQGSSRRELSGKVDGRSGELKPSTPTTPRSKHSATEQRRRCKINDRFQTLRDLIPHKDQKRDKASFLLEVIEYVKFLQEKMQQYESYTGWSQGHEKLTTWSNNQGPGDGMSDPHLPKNGPSHTGFYFPGRIVENNIPMIPSSLANTQNVAETDVPIGMDAVLAPIQSNYYSSVEKGSGLIHPLERLISDSDNLMSQSQSEWQRSSFAADCTGSSDMLNEQEELAIDEGTISISSVYSQGLLNALSQAVANYGIDLSEASISVQINLGRRANRISVANAPSREKDHENHSLIQQDAGGSRAGSNGEDSEHAHKRQKVDDSRPMEKLIAHHLLFEV